MHLRPYRIDDKTACLAMFDGNAPDFFALHERDEYKEFLETPGDRYWVVEDDTSAVVGCSGYRVIPETTTAIITWTMVERSVQGQGVGRLLILNDMDRLCRIPAIETVILETSQHIVEFYERVAGFQAHEVIDNGYAPGLHKVKMNRGMNKRDCETIAQQIDRLGLPRGSRNGVVFRNQKERDCHR